MSLGSACSPSTTMRIVLFLDIELSGLIEPLEVVALMELARRSVRCGDYAAFGQDEQAVRTKEPNC